MLEDFAMGNRVNRDRVAQRLASSTSIPTIGSQGIVPLQSPDVNMNELRTMNEHNPLAFFLPCDLDWVFKVMSVFPDARTSSILVHFYFDKLEWYTRVSSYDDLHRPFRHQLTFAW